MTTTNQTATCPPMRDGRLVAFDGLWPSTGDTGGPLTAVRPSVIGGPDCRLSEFRRVLYEAREPTLADDTQRERGRRLPGRHAPGLSDHNRLPTD